MHFISHRLNVCDPFKDKNRFTCIVTEIQEATAAESPIPLPYSTTGNQDNATTFSWRSDMVLKLSSINAYLIALSFHFTEMPMAQTTQKQFTLENSRSGK